MTAREYAQNLTEGDYGNMMLEIVESNSMFERTMYRTAEVACRMPWLDSKEIVDVSYFNAVTDKATLIVRGITE
jgi:hypothetical protein